MATTRASRPWRTTGALIVLLLAGCASPGPSLPPPPVHPNGQALWGIIHDHCVPDQQAHGDPSPCAVVAISKDDPRGEAHGYVLLKDRSGATQYLVMPTAKITGIEDPAILAPDATNYFAVAWKADPYVEAKLGRTLDRTQVSVAVNSIYGRSQDQLHLHVDCVDASVGAALGAAGISHDGRWASVQMKGHGWRVRWLNEAALETTNPFKLLAESFPGARRSMGAWTLAIVGARGPDGAKGFYLIADRADPAAGDPGSAEDLQDHACRT